MMDCPPGRVQLMPRWCQAQGWIASEEARAQIFLAGTSLSKVNRVQDQGTDLDAGADLDVDLDTDLDSGSDAGLDAGLDAGCDLGLGLGSGLGLGCAWA